MDIIFMANIDDKFYARKNNYNFFSLHQNKNKKWKSKKKKWVEQKIKILNIYVRKKFFCRQIL